MRWSGRLEKMAGGAFPPSLHMMKAEEGRKKKKGEHQDPDESGGRGGLKAVLLFCSPHFSLI